MAHLEGKMGSTHLGCKKDWKIEIENLGQKKKNSNQAAVATVVSFPHSILQCREMIIFFVPILKCIINCAFLFLHDTNKATMLFQITWKMSPRTTGIA